MKDNVKTDLQTETAKQPGWTPMKEILRKGGQTGPELTGGIQGPFKPADEERDAEWRREMHLFY
jgi:hypothetical protein